MIHLYKRQGTFRPLDETSLTIQQLLPETITPQKNIPSTDLLSNLEDNILTSVPKQDERLNLLEQERDEEFPIIETDTDNENILKDEDKEEESEEEDNTQEQEEQLSLNQEDDEIQSKEDEQEEQEQQEEQEESNEEEQLPPITETLTPNADLIKKSYKCKY